MTIAAGCRSGAVVFPCLGRGMCLRTGECQCSDGYLGASCQIGCPGLTEEGSYCSGRGNCSTLSVSPIRNSGGVGEGSGRAAVDVGADREGRQLAICTCQYGADLSCAPAVLL